MSQSYYNQFGQFRTYPPTGATQALLRGATRSIQQLFRKVQLFHRLALGLLHQQEFKIPGMLPAEQSYIENILRLNKGKLVTVYATFENNKEWNAKVFKGLIEAAGRDHLILSDPQTGERILLPMVYLDYVTFSEEIEYEYPFGAVPGLTTYPPR